MPSENKKYQIEWQRLIKQASKIIIIAMLLTGYSLNEVRAEENEGEIQTLFHIYSDGEYVGGLSDKSKLEKLKTDMVKMEAAEFENLSLTVGTDLSIVPERVFTVETTDDKVLEKLQENLLVEAKAIGIEVGGELALHVKDEEAYDEVIRGLKLQAVTEQELTEYEENEASIKDLPALKENESRIVKIALSADVQATTEQVSPKEVLTTNQALALLNKGKPEEKIHVVKSEDTPSKIAKEYGMTAAELVEVNDSLAEDNVIKAGDELNVTILEPFVEVVTHYETKRSEKVSFEKKTEKSNSLFKGDKKVSQIGSDGEKVITELIEKHNRKVIDKSIEDERVLVEPKDEITIVGTKVVPSRGKGSFKWPAVGGHVSSQMGTRWGKLHRGIDIARPTSRAILASDNGVVVSVGPDGGYGNKVVIDHNNGYKTLYAHLASIKVSVGQTVSQGTKLGVMGTTGHSTGIHLHFEVTKNGTLVDPMSVLK